MSNSIRFLKTHKEQGTRKLIEFYHWRAETKIMKVIQSEKYPRTISLEQKRNTIPKPGTMRLEFEMETEKYGSFSDQMKEVWIKWPQSTWG